MYMRALTLVNAVGVTPWANFRINAPMTYVFEKEGVEIPRSGKALVPGCGRVCKNTIVLE